MRNYFPELTIGILQIPIDAVPLESNGQDELNPTLIGLQNIHKNISLCLEILNLLKSEISENPKEKRGAKGLSLWELFVLTSIRRCGTIDYRKLADLASNHISLIGILGHGVVEGQLYSRSTLQENIALVKASTLDKINVLIVKHAQGYCNKTNEIVRVDSFVFEANIHYHADYKSLVDGSRCLLREGARLSNLMNVGGFRQAEHLTKKIKNLAYKITQKNRSTKETKEIEVRDLYIEILGAMEPIYEKIFTLLSAANKFDINLLNKSEKLKFEKLLSKIYFFFSGTAIEHELAYRRIVLGETIGAKEKIFSLFEPHSEMICKGKAKAPTEYGHLVVVAQCNNGFMLTGERMESGQKDKDICISFIKELQNTFDKQIKCMTFDKGYHSPDNKKEIGALVSDSLLMAKGKNAKQIRDKAYYEKKHWHSGVESSINALEQGNNMGVCKDKGLSGFDRCVKGSILARNIHSLGLIVIEQSRKKLVG